MVVRTKGAEERSGIQLAEEGTGDPVETVVDQVSRTHTAERWVEEAAVTAGLYAKQLDNRSKRIRSLGRRLAFFARWWPFRHGDVISTTLVSLSTRTGSGRHHNIVIFIVLSWGEQAHGRKQCKCTYPALLDHS